MNIDKSGTSDLLMNFITNDHVKRRTKKKHWAHWIQQNTKKQIVNEKATKHRKFSITKNAYRKYTTNLSKRGIFFVWIVSLVVQPLANLMGHLEGRKRTHFDCVCFFSISILCFVKRFILHHWFYNDGDDCIYLIWIMMRTCESPWQMMCVRFDSALCTLWNIPKKID